MPGSRCTSTGAEVSSPDCSMPTMPRCRNGWAERKQRDPRAWASRQEANYNHFGDRGSIDDLAFDPLSSTLLVSELKTGIYDVQRMLAKMDEKERLASEVARRFDWSVRRIVSCLVVTETSTNRRRVHQHRALFSRFDCRGRKAWAWLDDPTRPASGLLVFVSLSDVRGMHGRRAGRRRVRHSRSPSSVEGPEETAESRVADA
jgi:hypothetical protein